MKNLKILVIAALFALASSAACDRSSEPAEPSPDPQDLGKAMAEAMGKALMEGMVQMGEELGKAIEESAEEMRRFKDLGTLVEKARELGKLRHELKENPEAIDQLLEKIGLSEDELEELIFQIAKDPAASAAYAEAKP